MKSLTTFLILFAATSLFAEKQSRPADIHLSPEQNKVSRIKSIEDKSPASADVRPKAGRAESASMRIGRHKQKGEDAFPGGDQSGRRLLARGRGKSGASTGRTVKQIAERHPPMAARPEWP